jgi:photosystem II stability/assembly factor-like uncharacterized protein
MPIKILLLIFTLVTPLKNAFPQWISVTNGLSAYSKTTLVNDGINLFAGNYGGLFVSIDNGLKWQPTTLTNVNVQKILIDGNNIYTGGNGFYVSTNYGNSFSQSLSNFNTVLDIKKSENILYAACSYEGLNISFDNGISWVNKQNGRPMVGVEIKNGIVFVGCFGMLYTNNGGVFKTSDNGNTWLNTSLENTDIHFLKSNSDFLFAGNKDSLLKSNDNGESWVKLVLPSGVSHIENVNILDDVLYVSASDASYQKKLTYFSNDNGQNWEILSLEYDIVSIVKKSNRYVASVEYHGVFLSDDNRQSWDYYLHSDVGIRSHYKKDSRLFVGTTNYGIYFSDDQGINWKKANSKAKSINSFTSNDSYIFAGVFTYFSDTGGVYRSSDSGNTWEITNLRNRTISALHYYDSKLFAGESYSGVRQSLDNGNTWTHIGINGSVPYVIKDYNDKLFVGIYSSGLYYSTNSGESWIHSMLNNVSVNNLEWNSQYMYATSNQEAGLYHSSDEGITWQPSTLNKKSWDLVVSNNIIVVATTMEGIFVSKDNGLTWRNRNFNLPSNNTRILFQHDNFIFAGVSQIGLYKTTISELTNIESNTINIPNSYSLRQNFPNPFNPVTKISFSIPKSEIIKLSVYDINGRLIQTLFSGQIDAGSYELNFDATGLPSGLYFYKLESESFSGTKKMILLK